MTLPPPLLGPQDPAPVLLREGAHPRLVICCDHAGRAIPARLGDLGLSAQDRARHIAWDPGALAIAERLAARFGATLVAGVYSRLVIDLNRYPHDPAAMAARSDATDVPANAALTPAERWRRVAELHAPYHAALATALAARTRAFLLSVHTMTDRPATGVWRPQEVALSRLGPDPASEAALAVLRRLEEVTVGDNEPYGLDLGEDFTTPEHAVRAGLPHLQVEFRQDLVSESEGAARWADRFALALAAALDT